MRPILQALKQDVKFLAYFLLAALVISIEGLWSAVMSWPLPVAFSLALTVFITARQGRKSFIPLWLGFWVGSSWVLAMRTSALGWDLVVWSLAKASLVVICGGLASFILKRISKTLFDFENRRDVMTFMLVAGFMLPTFYALTDVSVMTMFLPMTWDRIWNDIFALALAQGFGVVTTALCLYQWPQSNQNKERSTWATGSIFLVLSVVAMSLMSQVLLKYEQSHLRTVITEEVQAYHNAVEETWSQLRFFMQAFSDLASGDQMMNQKDFNDYWQNIQTVHGSRALMWMPRVTAEDLGLFQLWALEEGRDWTFQASPNQSEFYPSYYAQPSAITSSLLGYDFTMNKLGSDLLKRIRQQGWVTTLQNFVTTEPTPKGYGWYYQAVYEGKKPISDTTGLKGIWGVLFDMKGLLPNYTSDFYQHFHLNLQHGSETQPLVGFRPQLFDQSLLASAQLFHPLQANADDLSIVKPIGSSFDKLRLSYRPSQDYVKKFATFNFKLFWLGGWVLQAIISSILLGWFVKRRQKVKKDVLKIKREERLQKRLLNGLTLARTGWWEYDVQTQQMTMSSDAYRLHGVPSLAQIDFDDMVALYDDRSGIGFEKALKQVTHNGGRLSCHVELSQGENRIERLKRYKRSSALRSQRERLKYEGVMLNSETPRKLRVLGMPLYEAGRCVCIQGVFVDDTQAALKESQFQLIQQFLLSVTNEGTHFVAVRDENENLLYCNKAYLRLFGLADHQMVNLIKDRLLNITDKYFGEMMNCGALPQGEKNQTVIDDLGVKHQIKFQKWFWAGESGRRMITLQLGYDETRLHRRLDHLSSQMLELAKQSPAMQSQEKLAVTKKLDEVVPAPVVTSRPEVVRADEWLEKTSVEVSQMEAQHPKVEIKDLASDPQAMADKDFFLNLTADAYRKFDNLCDKFDHLDQGSHIKSTLDESRKYLNDLGDFIQMNKGLLPLSTISFDLCYLMEDVCRSIQSDLKNASIMSHIDFSAISIPSQVQGDPSQLRRVLLAVLNTALCFKAKAPLGLSLQCTMDDPERVCAEFDVVISDSQVSPKKRQHLKDFIENPAADSDTKDLTSHLEWRVIKGLIKAMSGSLEVIQEDRKDFRIRLSIHLLKGRPCGKPDLAPLPQKRLLGKTVMIIDPEKNSRARIRRHCEEMGLQVVGMLGSAQAALRKLDDLMDQSVIPDVCLVEADLPYVNGYQFAQKIRRNDRCIGVKNILLTRDGRPGDAEKARLSGFNGYLSRPLRREELYGVIAGVLSKDTTANDTEIVTRHLAAEVSCVGVRALVIEDNPENRAIFSTYLGQLGCKGEFVRNGLEALERLNDESYDVCFMDTEIPLLRPQEATANIRRDLGDDLPIIALTDDVKKYKKRQLTGVNDYLNKPLSIVDIQDVITRFVVCKSNPV